MGYLINAWKETQKKFTMSLKQAVNIAGDGMLDNAESIGELREFFQMIDLQTMERFLGECCSKDKKYKFDTRGYAFQDLVNEMGRRLGYNVQHGLYRGKKNEIGFDGLWKSDDGYFIVMESKTSDDYSISVESVIGYRDQLVVDRKVPKKKCSILIVYGRDDKHALRNTVKGSDEAKNIRLISATALFQLVKLYSESKSSVIAKQVNSMMKPKDYFVLDNLVELVFPQTDDEIPDTEDDDAEAVETTVPPIVTVPPVEEKKGARGSTSASKLETVDDGATEGHTVLHLAGKKVKATGYLDGKTFVVLKGSGISPSETKSCAEGIKALRKTVVENGWVEDGRFIENVRFTSSSMAAACLIGGNQNGLIMWLNDDGVQLKNLV